MSTLSPAVSMRNEDNAEIVFYFYNWGLTVVAVVG